MPHPLTTPIINVTEVSGSETATLNLMSTCGPDENICGWVYDWTGNQQLANVADWVVGKP